jgi:hypothetical protein
MSVRDLLAPAVVWSLCVWAVTGCSKSADEIKAARAAHESGQEGSAQTVVRVRAPKPAAAAPGDAELVSAVIADNTPAGDAPPYDLRFRLLARPEVSQTVQIELVAVPASDTQFVHLLLGVQPGDGIGITGDSTFDDRDLPTGQRVRHTISVIPARAGVLQLYVNAAVVTDKTSLSRQFAIPLIAVGAEPASPGR